MEFYADLEYISLYVSNLYPSGIAIEIPTWLLVGTIALVWSIRQWKKYLAEYSVEQLRRKAHLENGGTLANYDRTHYLDQE